MIHGVLFFAWGPFASAGLLWWAAASLIPIVIHLWNRRRYRIERWAAMEYLLAAMKQQARRILFRQWLLLALRALLLVLFAVALAEPLFFSHVAPGRGNSQGQVYTILVIDGSYSMDTRLQGVSRFSRAKEMAANVVEQGGLGDGYSLYLLADAPRSIIGEPAFEPRDVIAEIDSLEMPHGGSNLSALLDELLSRCKNVRKHFPKFTQTRVLFFTDLGRSSWEPVVAGQGGSAISDLAQHASLVLFPIHEEPQPNCAITRFAAKHRTAGVGAEQLFEVEARCLGGAVSAQRALRLLVDGQRVAEQSISFAGSSAVHSTFSYRFQTPGEHLVSVELDEDLLPLDDRRWLSLPVRESARVLCVEGRRGEARELALAIEPRTAGRRKIETVVRNETALLEDDLLQFDGIFLCNVPRLTANEAAVLHNFVSQGGGLVVFLGDLADAENYNAALGDKKTARRLLPATLGPVVKGDAGFRFNPLAYRHAMVREFDGVQRNGLLLAPVWRYRKLVPCDAASSRVAIAFDNGDPALIEESFGRGKVVLFATAASLNSIDRTATPPIPWTALSTYRAYLPLVQGMTQWALTDHAASRNVLVGEPISSSRSAIGAGEELEVSGPLFAAPANTAVRREKVRLRYEGGVASWEFDDTRTSGVYRAGAENSSTSQVFSVNINPASGESDPAQLDDEELPPIFERASANPSIGGAAAAGVRLSYFRVFLAFVLCMLLAETWIAWRSGRGVA